MSALLQWYQELKAGTRGTNTWDALFRAACKDAEDNEFRRTVTAAQDRFLAELAERSRPAPAETIPDQCPALERWRQRTIEERGADPLAVAAAWELSAVHAEQSGALDVAEQCRSNAVHAMRPRPAVCRPS